MENRSDKQKKMSARKFGEYYILIGLSIVLSIASSNWVILYQMSLAKVFESYSIMEMLIFLIGCIVLIQGIYIYSKPEITFKSKRVLIFIPYIIIYYMIWQFYIHMKIYGEMKETIILLTFLFFLWIAVLYEMFKFIKAIKNILKNSVKDSKDRLSIVITIIATIISAIALFK